MRSIALALLLAPMLVVHAGAVPVNPAGVAGVAATLPAVMTGALDTEFYVLTTGGEVWFANPGATNPGYSGEVWMHQGIGVQPGALDPPVPVAEIAEWWLWGFLTREGVFWSYIARDSQWHQLPPPPFGPVAAQRKSLSSAKQGYR